MAEQNSPYRSMYLDPINSTPVRTTINPQHGFNPPASANTGYRPLGVNLNTPPENSYWLGDGTDKNPGVLIPGIQAFNGLAQAYTGYKSLRLGQDQFDFAKAQANRNIQGQATNYNMLLENSYNNHLNWKGKYDQDTPEGRAAFQADLESYINRNKVDGSPIG